MQKACERFPPPLLPLQFILFLIFHVISFPWKKKNQTQNPNPPPPSRLILGRCLGTLFALNWIVALFHRYEGSSRDPPTRSLDQVLVLYKHTTKRRVGSKSLPWHGDMREVPRNTFFFLSSQTCLSEWWPLIFHPTTSGSWCEKTQSWLQVHTKYPIQESGAVISSRQQFRACYPARHPPELCVPQKTSFVASTSL